MTVIPNEENQIQTRKTNPLAKSDVRALLDFEMYGYDSTSYM
jgi:hypothetical protein